MSQASLLSGLILLLVAGVIPALIPWQALRPLERLGRQLARRRAAACGAIFVLSLAVSSGISLTTHIPVPVVHDEFSYLLAADTFAHGHLTNPQHPMWKSFETFHVLSQPTRQSKYPPGQGLTLALGKLLTGLPIAGVWLTTALASAAICWMLMAWFPVRWALVGGLLATLHPMVLKWSQVYWGGSLPLLGGALVFGGLGRCLQIRPRSERTGSRISPDLSGGLAIGLGASILGLSRPFEGAAMVAFAVVVLAIEWRRRTPAATDAPSPVLRIVAGAAAPLVVALLFLGIYNDRVTGSPLRLPYTVYEHEYCPVPVLLFGHIRPFPTYYNAPMRAMITDYDEPLYIDETRDVKGVLRYAVLKMSLLAKFGLQTFDLSTFALDPVGPIKNVFIESLKYVQYLPLLALPVLWQKSRWVRYILVGIAIGVLSVLTEPYLNTHYAAPSAPLLALAMIFCLRAIWTTRWKGRPLGRSFVRTLMILYVAAFCVCYRQYTQAPPVRFAVDRIATEQRLSRLPGDQLVIVRYLPGHDWGKEVVYNAADIDHSKVVWARDLDPDQNRMLLSYYHNRRVWLYQPDPKPAVLVPYVAGHS